MIALIQRVTQARVRAGGADVGAIDGGVLALVCAEDTGGHRRVARAGLGDEVIEQPLALGRRRGRTEARPRAA